MKQATEVLEQTDTFTAIGVAAAKLLTGILDRQILKLRLAARFPWCAIRSCRAPLN